MRLQAAYTAWSNDSMYRIKAHTLLCLNWCATLRVRVGRRAHEPRRRRRRRRSLPLIEHAMDAVMTDRIPGDFVEAGVYRGGASIFMRAYLEAWGITTRRVWLYDTFAGIPLARNTSNADNVGARGG